MILEYSNNATSLLSSAVTSSATTIPLVTGGGAAFPALTTGEAFYVTIMDAATQLTKEIVLCTARSGDTLTVTRAQQGTTALAWAASSIVAQLLTAGDMNNFIQTTTVQSGYLNFAVGTGTANSLLATLPSLMTALVDGMPLTVEAVAANTGAMTLTLTLGSTVTGSFAVVKYGNVPLIAGDVPAAKYPMELVWSSTFNAFVLNNPSVVIPPQIQSVGASVASNALTVTYAGGSLTFRNPTLSNGAPVQATVGAQTLTVPSGATLGATSAVQSQLVVLVAYNAGSPVLCVCNGMNVDESSLISPTTISAGATSAGVIYSASAVSANSPFRIAGYLTISEATAGTWATAPTQVQGWGGFQKGPVNIFSGVPVALAAQTAVLFSGIPAWVKRVTMSFVGLGTNGTNRPIIQIGSGSLTSSGYTGTVQQGTTTIANDSNGVSLNTSWVSGVRESGSVVFDLVSANTWVATGVLGRSDTPASIQVAATVAISGALDSIQLTTNAGTDTLNAGTVNITWE